MVNVIVVPVRQYSPPWGVAAGYPVVLSFHDLPPWPDPCRSSRCEGTPTVSTGDVMHRRLRVRCRYRAVVGSQWACFGLAVLVALHSLFGAPPVRAAVTLEGFVPGAGTAGDVVVDPASHLAYVASAEFGLSVVDVSNPGQPAAIGGANPPFYGTRVAVSGSLAVVGGAALGLRVVDVSVPTAPQTVGSMSGTINGVARAGQYAYVLISVPGNPAHIDLAIVDLSTPASPSIVGRVTLAGGIAIKVVGGFAYVAAGGPGLQIVDVSVPTAPAIVRTVDTPGGAKGVAVGGGYAYVADGNSIQVINVQVPGTAAIAGSLSMSSATAVAVTAARLYVIDGTLLKVVNVSTPASPVLMGSTDASGAASLDAVGSMAFLASAAVDPIAGSGGLYVVDASNPANPAGLTNVYGGFGSAGVAVSGSLAVASGGSVGMKVVDVSVPSAPRAVASVGGSIGDVALAGHIAYALLSVPGNPAHTDLIIVDLSTPSAPVIRSQKTLAGGTAIRVSGGFAYVTCGGAGLQIIDVGTPTNPLIVRTVDTPGAAKGVALANGYAYVADDSSVQIVDVHTPASAFIAGSVAASAASAVTVAGNQLYVIDGGQLRVLDLSAPLSPAQLSSSSAYGTQTLAASSNMVYLTRAAIDHSDPAGGLYIIDVSTPALPQLLSQMIVPGLTRAVAATTTFVYVGDAAAIVDVGRITVPPPPPTPTSTSTPAATPTRSPTATAGSTPPVTPTPTDPPGATVTATPAATPTTGPPLPFGSFRCYSAHVKKYTAAFKPVRSVNFVDRFGPLPRNIGAPGRVCNPADMNGQDPTALTQPDHLTGYRLWASKGMPKFVKLTGQQVVNQFGTVSVDVVSPLRLLVPGAQSLSDPPPMPSAGIDSFDCYRVRLTRNAINAATLPSSATVQDQFGTTTVNVKAPTMLCVPGDRNGTAPDAIAHPDLLMCYLATRVRGTSQFKKVSPVFVANALQQGTLEAPMPLELCVPTRMAP